MALQGKSGLFSFHRYFVHVNEFVKSFNLISLRIH